MAAIAQPRAREYGLDWLRVIAFLILIGYHTGMFFVPWTFHIKNPEQSQALTWVMIFFNRWRLPLLFFISGAGVAFSLRRRSLPQFATERLRRLLLPLVFGMLVIVPPQIYFERLTQGLHYDSYFQFWGTVLEGVSYPKGSLSWHHLWFVAYIFVYSLVCLPLFAFLKSPSGQRMADSLARLAERPGLIYLVNIPNLVVAFTLGPHWPTTHNLTSDWANLIGSLLTFLWGFIICGTPRFLGVIESKRREFLILAIVLTFAFYGLRIAGARSIQLVDSYFGMAWILTLVGWSRACLNRESAVLRYANNAVYPFYILHQTIIITLAYPMITWPAPIAIKFPLLAAGTFLGCWVIYEGARRVPVLRPLLGIAH